MESDSLVQKWTGRQTSGSMDRASDFWFDGPGARLPGSNSEPGVRLPGPFSGSKNGWTAAIIFWLRSTRSISLFQHIHK